MAWPAIHKPKMVPAHGIEQVFRCWVQVAARAQCLGHHLLQAPYNSRALGNALTRVNIANRYPGNKASEYETRWWQPLPGAVDSTKAADTIANGQLNSVTRRRCELAVNSLHRQPFAKFAQPRLP